jgi:hypothetical protein
MSRKKTQSAERINPAPRLKIMRQIIGNRSIKKCIFIGMPSATTNIKNRQRDKPKLIREETFFENKNMYLGTFTFVNMPALFSNASIPVDVDSRK